jgi:hypothetical protein
MIIGSLAGTQRFLRIFGPDRDMALNQFLCVLSIKTGRITA